jgi:hypothetical protein
MRSLPLPKGTKLLLRLAAHDAGAAHEAYRLCGRPACATEQAAIFFIEQILLSPDADEYRILGLDHTATIKELRCHMALLLKWLYQDIVSESHKSFMVRRVIEAWNEVKSPIRRAHPNKNISAVDREVNALPASDRASHRWFDRERTYPRKRSGLGLILRLIVRFAQSKSAQYWT